MKIYKKQTNIETVSHEIQAVLKVTVCVTKHNFKFLILLRPPRQVLRLQVVIAKPVYISARDGTQAFVHAVGPLHQLSCVLQPVFYIGGSQFSFNPISQVVLRGQCRSGPVFINLHTVLVPRRDVSKPSLQI